MSNQKLQKPTNSFEILEKWKKENKKITLIDNPGEFKLIIGDEQVPFVQNYKVGADPAGITLIFELRVPNELFSNDVER